MDDYSWVLNALSGFLPEPTARLLHDHILHPNSTLSTLRNHISALSRRTLGLLTPYIAPLLERSIQALHDSPDVVVLAFLLAVLVVAIQAMLWVHRTMMFFTRLAMRLVWWAVVAGLLAAVWQRGPETAARDVVVFVSKAVGYAAVVKDIWMSEYQRYDAQTRGGSGGNQRLPGHGPARRAGR
ncbi:Uu.00g019540.m01.CDS01 [Anthostomella pinea]|uniref:Uu.00g019540.m01.CDS01 n=1 Tax=Anthostomella pinea TaxID=933095 RepID=A0AAI8YQS1_9PEZI|nr:Uu.00g019540.m01.CDS01 [Anthostomella pinea]